MLELVLCQWHSAPSWVVEDITVFDRHVFSDSWLTWSRNLREMEKSQEILFGTQDLLYW